MPETVALCDASADRVALPDVEADEEIDSELLADPVLFMEGGKVTVKELVRLKVLVCVPVVVPEAVKDPDLDAVLSEDAVASEVIETVLRAEEESIEDADTMADSELLRLAVGVRDSIADTLIAPDCDVVGL